MDCVSPFNLLEGHGTMLLAVSHSLAIRSSQFRSIIAVVRRFDQVGGF